MAETTRRKRPKDLNKHYCEQQTNEVGVSGGRGVCVGGGGGRERSYIQLKQLEIQEKTHGKNKAKNKTKTTKTIQN